jgi:hypothetical protein
VGDEDEAMAAEISAPGIPATVVRLVNPDGATRSGAGGQVGVFGQGIAVAICAVHRPIGTRE